ncbi:cysteine-rich receptor-like protein kinase 27, partial [Quercus suber]
LVIPTSAQYCYNTGNYTSNSTYKANFNSLLASTINDTKFDYGFFNLSTGESPDKVYAIALCRGDTSPSECRSCINGIRNDLLRSCPNQKEAIIWGETCSLRYSFRSIFNIMEARPLIIAANTANFSDVEGFNDGLRPLLDSLRNRAASGNSTHKFALKSVAAPKFQTIYSLVECTPDLSELDCSSCLQRLQDYIPLCCDGKQGLKFVTPSCDLSRTTIASIVSAVLIILSASALFKSENPVDKVKVIDTDDQISVVECLQFDFGKIRVATQNFSDANKLGRVDLVLFTRIPYVKTIFSLLLCYNYFNMQAWKKWKDGTTSNLIDPTLCTDSTTEIIKCIHIGLLCVQENMVKRPTMASVVLMLNSESMTLSIPSRPAFTMYSNTRSSVLHVEHKSGVMGSTQSRSSSVQASVNDVSITELDPWQC